MNRLYPLCAVLTGAGLLAACETVPSVPIAPATLEYSRAGCADAPDLSSAVGLTPDKERAVFTVTAPAAGATCLNEGGTQTPYVVFALPADHADKTVTVGSVLEPLRILSPKVVILDRQGAVSRTFDAGDYMYRGSVFSVQFRPRATDGYVLVTADPGRVGRRYDSIAIGVATTTVYTGYGASNWHSGVDVAQSRTFSYEGAVQVMINDADTEEKGDQP